MNLFSTGRYILISSLLLFGLILNIFVFNNLIIGLIVGTLYLLYYSIALGYIYFSHYSQPIKFLGGLQMTLILFIVLGSLAYYFFGLTNVVCSLLLILLTFLIFALGRNNFFRIFSNIQNNFLIPSLKARVTKIFFLQHSKTIILTGIYLALAALSFLIIFQHQTSEAIRSPWEILPSEFLVIYALCGLLLLLIIFKKNNSWLKYVCLSIFIFLSLSITMIIYKIGYGFDPFIHRAAEKVIFNYGAINPKSWYYIGQYALVTMLAKIFYLNSSLLDKILLPILSGLLLPIIGWLYFYKNKLVQSAWLLPLAIIFLPMNNYLTLPQNLANFFLLIFIVSTGQDKKVFNLLSILFVLAIIFIHPLSGLVALIILIVNSVSLLENIKKQLKLVIYALLSCLVPLAFWLGSFLLKNYTLIWQNGFKNTAWLELNIKWVKFNSIYHFVYLYKFNIIIIFLLLVAFGWYLSKKHLYLKTFIIVLINIIFLQLLKFSSLISYEQNDFTKRLINIALIVLTPYFLISLDFIWNKFLNNKRTLALTSLIIVCLLSINLYLMYPRVDAFEKSRGYSTSLNDIKAVREIASRQLKNQDYIVLSNQAVSAAAIQEFGFKKYYSTPEGPLFYYPVPTGSPLYKIYLDMIYYGPTLNQVKEKTGVQTVYFVINDYWLDAEKRIVETRTIANEAFNINKKIWIFKF